MRQDLRHGNAPEVANEQIPILCLLEPQEQAPEQITGQTLVAIANYGDMAVRLTDQLNIPRESLAQAVSAAAARVG